MKSYYFLQIIQFMLMLLFGYAAFSKLADHALFQSQLTDFPAIGNHAILFSWLIPFVELGTLVLLLFPRTRQFGFYVSALLLTAFSFFLLYMLGFSAKLPCSCGGILAKLSWQQHLALNLFFLVLSIAGIWLQERYKASISILNKENNASSENIVATNRGIRKPV